MSTTGLQAAQVAAGGDDLKARFKVVVAVGAAGKQGSLPST